MKKVLKNILKWLICVFLTFSVIFTILNFENILGGIYFEIAVLRNNGEYEYFFGEENLEEAVKWHDEITNEQFLNNTGNEEDIMVKLYPQYPAGVTRTMYMIANYVTYADLANLSLILGVIMGTAIYMLLDTDKKGLKIVVLIYILSIVVLGFVQGLITISGEDLTLLDRWMFPDEYIIPVSIVFALVVIVRFIKQKDIAKKLNEKLKEINNK